MAYTFKLLPVFSAALIALASPVLARDITHELGTTDVPDDPKRIVVLEFSYIDALASVGVAPVGLADDGKRDRVIAPYIDVIGDDWVSVGTRKTPSLEIIASLQPDLIIADKTRHTAAYDTLSEIAPTIVLDSLGGDYHASVAQMAAIGTAIGKSVEMEARITAHKATMAEYVAQIKPKAEGIAAQFGVTNAKGLWLHSPRSYNGSLLEMFGFDSNMETADGAVYEKVYVPTTLEQLSEIDPDLLLVGAYADPSFVDGWAGETLYENLTSVKADQVLPVTAHNWSRLRGMLAAEMTAADVVRIMDALE
ncbi:ABC transporter substrate-binding protein [Shimia sagamensis]|uniref:Iron complex transport system substrate-binding protein n=1 Tax=Shimia sagamensis TaxID=1566352 RepID=A0ABY1P0E9_9RHOB|nr:Fe(3+) dicitrate ABC transporter substrate-binding protein [Shimia sagamensis]SMP23402.1 iron complex transport system substrate-binding protein [Shimia sagamensis]